MNQLKAAIKVNGKPLNEYLDHEIAEALAQETEAELTKEEEEAADAATD